MSIESSKRNHMTNKAIYMRYLTCFSFTLICLVAFLPGKAQDTLTLVDAYDLTEINIPILRTKDLYEEIESAKKKLLGHSRKPTVSLRGNAGLQSESIQIGSSSPDSPIHIDVPLYNARAFGELNYNLYDGGIIKSRQHIEELERLVQQQQVEVDIYPYREQVNRLFTSIHLSRTIIALYDLTSEELHLRLSKIRAGIRLGVTLESEETKIRVRQLEIDNEISTIQGSIQSAFATLSVLTGRTLLTNTILEFPANISSLENLSISRPELILFERQTDALSSQKVLIEQLDKPNIWLFAQTGIAYPNALNFSKVQLAPFAMVGVSFNYKIFDKKDKSYELQKIDLEKKLLTIRSEQFKHNIVIEGARYSSEIDALQEQLKNLEEIIQLQSELLDQLGVQLDNGVITVTDYLLQSNAELKSRQNREIIKSKLIQKKLAYSTIYGTTHFE